MTSVVIFVVKSKGFSTKFPLNDKYILQKDQFVLSPDIVEMLKNKKEEMLETAYHCFKTASEFKDENGVEEKWLHHYMLGKIAEKRYMKEPKPYLSQYKQVILSTIGIFHFNF